MTVSTDPRIEQALELIARVGALLSRAEHILRTVPPSAIQRMDLVTRGLLQSQHNLSMAWNAALADVKLTVPAPFVPPAIPVPDLRTDEGRMRMQALDVEKGLGEGPIEWRTR